MTEVIVSIENNWAIDNVIDAIKMLKGVTSARLWKSDAQQPRAIETGKYSSRIERLCRMKGKGITQSDIDNDSRLAYLLNK